jgi:hypothetical protein
MNFSQVQEILILMHSVLLDISEVTLKEETYEKTIVYSLIHMGIKAWDPSTVSQILLLTPPLTVHLGHFLL